jgi:hypothetical protein
MSLKKKPGFVVLPEDVIDSLIESLQAANAKELVIRLEDLLDGKEILEQS